MMHLVVLLALFGGASSNVIGIDFGTELIKVALVQPGSPLEIVTNTISKRKTEACISFDRGDRMFGADAFGLLSRKPQFTYAKMTTLLGRTADHASVKALSAQHFPTEVYFNETRGGLCVKSPADYWTPEELTAMILSHVKDITKAFGGKLVRDCVITVPMYFTQHERAALLDAAEIADMRVLSLIDENTAAALQYSLDRVFEEPQNVLFFNMGSQSTQVSIVQYSSQTVKELGKNKTLGQFEVVGKGWDGELGGVHFDMLLTELLADEFNQKWGNGEIRDIARPMAKLRAEGKKKKEVLSANTAIPIHIPSLHDDIDFASHMSRERLDTMGAALLDRLLLPIDVALKSANMTLEDIHAVELIGGSVRIPKVQTVLKEKIGEKELGMHLNGDEAMALGAAFHAANLSTAFRVRKVAMADYLPFAIGVRLHALEKTPGFLGGMLNSVLGVADAKKSDDEAPWTKRASLFKDGHKLDAKRTIAFQHDDDIVCNLTYEASDLLPALTAPTLAMYNISGIAAFAEEMAKKGLGKPKVHLSFTLDSSGIAKLTKADATVEEMLEPEAEAASGDDAENATASKEPAADSDAPTDASKDDAAAADDAAGAKAEDTAEEKPAADAADSENASATNSSEDVNATGSNSSNSSETGNSTAAAKPKKKTHRKALTIVASMNGRVYHEMSEEEKTVSIARLAELQRQDDIRKERGEAKNALESYLYQARGKVMEEEEEVDKVSTEEQKQAVLTLVEETEEWLYGDGDEAEASAYFEKERAIVTLSDAIFLRVTESTDRPKAMAKARETLTSTEETTVVWETTKPQITEEERNDVLDRVEKIRKWLSEREDEQSAKAVHEEPAFLSKDIAAQLKPLKTLVDKLGRKPKPAPPKKNDTDSNSTSNESSNGTTVNTTNTTNTTNSTDTADAAEAESDEEMEAMREEL